MLALLVLALLVAQAAAKYSNPMGISARIQWPNAGGYCGETSAQMAALLHGAWVSQGAWRAAGAGGNGAGGQLLLSVNLEPVLTKMGLRWARWDQTVEARALARSGKPQYAAFTAWVKARLASKSPVIFGEFVADALDDPDYDHIVPAVGASSGGDLTFFDLYRLTPHVRLFSQLSASRRGCQKDLLEGGCIPVTTNYGTAITGVVDADKATVPVRLAVDRADEPNYSPIDADDEYEYRAAPEKATPLHGTVTVSGLTPGRSYRLMRFNSPSKVPTKGTAAAFLTSSYESFVDFTASGSTYKYADPKAFLSSATVFYRCVAKP